MKRYLALFLAATVTFSLVGCSSQPNNSTGDGSSADSTSANDSTTISFAQYSLGADNVPYANQMVQSFEDSNPNIKVDMQTYGFDDYFSTIETKIAGGQSPDVYEMNLENFSAFASKNALEDLGPYMQSSNFAVDNFNPTALSAFQYKGTQFGLPENFSTVLLFYNKDLFDQAGVSYPTSDWTWDDMDNAGEQIKALGDDYYGLLQPCTFNEFFKLAAQNGGAVVSDGQYTMNSTENVETLQRIVDRYLKTNIIPTDEQMGGMTDLDMFATGKIGMIMTGSWAFSTFKDSCNFNWDVAVEPGNTQKATHFFSDAYTMSTNSKNKDQAFELISYLVSSEDVANIRLDNDLGVPSLQTQEIKDKYIAQTPPDNKQAVYDSMDYITLPPQLIDYHEIADMCDQYLGEAKTGDISPQEALDSIQSKLVSDYPLDKEQP